jgi:hypothetical protein
MKMASETLVNFYQTTRRYNQEEAIFIRAIPDDGGSKDL